MKYWKRDFFRRQDQEKMDTLIKKLVKMRMKMKTNFESRKYSSNEINESLKSNQTVKRNTVRKGNAKDNIGSSNRRIIK